MNRILLLATALAVAGAITAQTSAFNFVSTPRTSEEFRELAVDLDGLWKQLVKSPRVTGAKRPNVLRLPLPDGQFAEFTTVDRPALDPAFSRRYPGIRSYIVEGPWGGGRIAVSHRGIDALLRGPNGRFAIEPDPQTGDDHHRIYYSDAYHDPELLGPPLGCGFDANGITTPPLDGKLTSGGEVPGKRAAGDPRELRQYDIVLTSTGEFARQVGGELSDVVAAFNTAISTVNAIFENEVGITLNVLAVSESLIFLDADTDPYIDANQGKELLSQIIDAFQDADVPNTAYDLGHLFTGGCSDVGGVVSGRACTSGKTRGVTCQSNSNVARTAERIMAHEIAHQFDVSHTWNNCPDELDQRASDTAYEPGAGTTIMSYAGTCGTQNVGALDPYYHVASLEQFLFYTRQGGARGCATVIETDNVGPEVFLDYEDGFFIPKGTPFVLTGTATDANGDALTYNWEEYDLGPVVDVSNPEGNAPVFRSVAPSPDGHTRYFPRVDRVANGILMGRSEYLADYGRAYTFRLVVRDNNPAAGAVEWATVRFRASDGVGPFTVDEPDFGDSLAWRVGEYREVTWDVAGTDGFPVFTDRVNILLSDDGGVTFERVLAADVANNGSAFVTVPDMVGTAMRIVVEAADNVYYNMNRENFSILPAVRPTYTLESDLRYARVCLPDELSVRFTSGSVLGFSTPLSLEVITEELPAGLVVTLSDSELLPGETATLGLNLFDVVDSERITVPIRITGPGLDTARREIVLDVVANDFSDQQQLNPIEGLSGVGLSTTFTWEPSRNAERYDIQIATSATFAPSTIFASALDLEDNTFTATDFFPVNTLFFWRIRPENVCGDGPWSDPVSFRTVNSDCAIVNSTDTPISLPGSGRTYTRTSTLSVDRRGAINDLNLPAVDFRYQFVSGLKLTLISPAGTRVVLYDEDCFSTNRLTIGFDDDAPREIVCPPDDRVVFQPVGKLSDFNGEDTFGDWQLEVAVSETNGAVGQFGAWSVEFCSAVDARTPETVTNDTTRVMPFGRNRILRDNLEVISEGFTTNFTYYIITAPPRAGVLTLSDRALMLGDTFTQADINGQRLVYEHTDLDQLVDSISFVVSTPEGGYLPLTHHRIVVDEDAITGSRDFDPLEESLEVFPNPTFGEVNLRWRFAGMSRQLGIELYDLHGRRLWQRSVPSGAGQTSFGTDALLPGIYLLRVGGSVRRLVKN